MMLAAALEEARPKEEKGKNTRKPDGIVGHVIHYPLNGLDLDFSRYAALPFGTKDIMMHRLFQDYLFPRELPMSSYMKCFGLYAFWPHIGHGLKLARDKHLDLPRLYLDHLTLQAMLVTMPLLRDLKLMKLMPVLSNVASMDPWDRMPGFPLMEHRVVDLAQRYYLEAACCATREILDAHWRMSDRLYKYAQSDGTWMQLRDYYEKAHYDSYPRHREVYDRYWLFSNARRDRSLAFSLLGKPLENNVGNIYLVPRGARRPPKREVSPGSIERIRNTLRASQSRRTRHSSLPSRPYNMAFARSIYGNDDNLSTLILFPNRSISEIDHLTRRRSLSRRHIARMFTRAPDEEGGEQRGQRYCGICCSEEHTSKTCRNCCLHCGGKNHETERCHIARKMICKCRPFPQLHTAAYCRIKCSRALPQHYKLCRSLSGRHKCAMKCQLRCCMCGAEGHPGISCELWKCRCGGSHLGQACGWNPTCRVKGCSLYRCDLHCAECGSAQGPFVARRCAACLKNGVPVGERVRESRPEQQPEQPEWKRKPNAGPGERKRRLVARGRGRGRGRAGGRSSTSGSRRQS